MGATSICHPLDTIKVRLQTQQNQPKLLLGTFGTNKIFFDIFNNYNEHNDFKGWLRTLLKLQASFRCTAVSQQLCFDKSPIQRFDLPFTKLPRL